MHSLFLQTNLVDQTYLASTLLTEGFFRVGCSYFVKKKFWLPVGLLLYELNDKSNYYRASSSAFCSFLNRSEAAALMISRRDCILEF